MDLDKLEGRDNKLANYTKGFDYGFLKQAFGERR